jgi:hypothetical protein
MVDAISRRVRVTGTIGADGATQVGLYGWLSILGARRAAASGTTRGLALLTRSITKTMPRATLLALDFRHTTFNERNHHMSDNTALAAKILNVVGDLHIDSHIRDAQEKRDCLTSKQSIHRGAYPAANFTPPALDPKLYEPFVA